MNRPLLALLITLAPTLVGAQTVEILSHYPGTAFVTGRLLPFTVGGPGEVTISKVSIKNDTICSALADPFYPAIFHVYCQQPGPVTTEILYRRQGQLEKTELTIELFSEREPVARNP